MREKVRAFMEQYHMVTAGERVLLGPTSDDEDPDAQQ